MNFSKTMPDLIEPKIDEVVQEVTGSKIYVDTFSENICNSIHNLYENYFKKYFFFVLVIIVIILFLLYRYYKNKEEKRKKIISRDFITQETSLNAEDKMTKQIYEILKQRKKNTNVVKN